MLCSTDLAKSLEFYEQRLGLKLSPETITNHLLFETNGGTTLLVYGRPSPNAADHTQVRFWTNDVAADVRELSARGVIFEDYDFPASKTLDRVATTPGIGKSACFKDPDASYNTVRVTSRDLRDLKIRVKTLLAPVLSARDDDRQFTPPRSTL